MQAELAEQPMLPRFDASEVVSQVHRDAAPLFFAHLRARAGTFRNVPSAIPIPTAPACPYDQRCAFTRLDLTNGCGRAEAEAAHILPVQPNSPYRVTNGLALSETTHWMFDRAPTSVADDIEILISRQVDDADGCGRY